MPQLWDSELPVWTSSCKPHHKVRARDTWPSAGTTDSDLVGAEMVKTYPTPTLTISLWVQRKWRGSLVQPWRPQEIPVCNVLEAKEEEEHCISSLCTD